MKKILIEKSVKIPGTDILLERGDRVIIKESLSSSMVKKAKAYWTNLCKKYSASKFERMINQQDGDYFFEVMADALGMDVMDAYEFIEEYMGEIFDEITDPIEIEFYGKPISSNF